MRSIHLTSFFPHNLPHYVCYSCIICYTICISRCFLKLLKHALFFFRRTNTYIHKHYCTISLLLHNLQCNLFVNLFNCKVSHFPGPAVSIMLRLKKMLVKQWRDTLYIYIPGYVYVSSSQRTTADFGFLTKQNENSDMTMEVWLSAILGNYDRQANRPTIRLTD